MRFASDGMALGMTVCLTLRSQGCRRPWRDVSMRSWPEQVLPYGLAEDLWITPSGWTRTEASREIRLPALPTPETAPHCHAT